jgi:hypothetical protein
MAGSGFLACRRCGALLDSHFCTTCGLDSRCSKCGATVTTPFCVGCGTSAAPTVRSSIPPSRNQAEQEGDNSSAAADGNGEAPETRSNRSVPNDVSLIAEIEYPLDASATETESGFQVDDAAKAPATTDLSTPSSVSERGHSDEASTNHTPGPPRLVPSGRKRKILAIGTLASVAHTSDSLSETELSEPVDRCSHRRRRLIALGGAVIIATVVGLGIFIAGTSGTSRSNDQDVALTADGSAASSLGTESEPKSTSSGEASADGSGLPGESTGSGDGQTKNQQGGNLVPSPPGTIGNPLPVSPSQPVPYTVPTFTRMLASNALAMLKSAQTQSLIGFGYGNNCLSPGAYVTYMHPDSPVPGSVVVSQKPAIVIYCDSQPFTLPNYTGVSLCSPGGCGALDGILYPRWDPSCMDSSFPGIRQNAVVTSQSPAPGTFFWPRDDDLFISC